MEKIFEDDGGKEDFSLRQLSSVPTISAAPWSPGYGEDSQVREADDPRIRESDYNGKLVQLLLVSVLIQHCGIKFSVWDCCFTALVT